MALYQVIAEGFYEGKLFQPNGKRNKLYREKAFKQCPSWLKPIKEMTAAEKKAEAAAAKKAAEQQEKDAAEKKTEVDSVTFIDTPDASSKVETL